MSPIISLAVCAVIETEKKFTVVVTLLAYTHHLSAQTVILSRVLRVLTEEYSLHQKRALSRCQVTCKPVTPPWVTESKLFFLELVVSLVTIAIMLLWPCWRHIMYISIQNKMPLKNDPRLVSFILFFGSLFYLFKWGSHRVWLHLAKRSTYRSASEYQNRLRKLLKKINT